MVQDNQALAMVSLKGEDSFDDRDNRKNKYYLNLKDMGFTKDSTTKVLALVEAMEQYLPKGGYSTTTNAFGLPEHEADATTEKTAERIYFKFKYNLSNNNANSAEFISGYAAVRKIGADDNGVYLSLGNVENKAVYKNREGIPRQLCYDYITGMNNQNFDFAHQQSAYPMLEVDSTTGSAMDALSLIHI